MLAASRLSNCGWWNEAPLLEIQHQPPRSLGTFSAHVPAKSWRRWCPKGTDTTGLLSTAAAGPAGEPSSLAAAAARPSRLALPHVYGISPWICSCFFHPLPQSFMLSTTREPPCPPQGSNYSCTVLLQNLTSYQKPPALTLLRFLFKA